MTDKPLEIRFLIDVDDIDDLVSLMTRDEWVIKSKSYLSGGCVHVIAVFDRAALSQDQPAEDDPYKRLAHEIIMPPSHALWWQVLNEVQKKHVLGVGFVKFGEQHVQGKGLLDSRLDALTAMEDAAKHLAQIARLEMKRIAPAIRQIIAEKIKDQPDSFDTGYAVADALKAADYTYEQVCFALSYRYPELVESCTRGGIQIKYTGRYD